MAMADTAPHRLVHEERWQESGEAMSTQFKFTYPPKTLARQSSTSWGKQLGIVTKVRRANIGDTHGWIETELGGAPRAIDAATVSGS
jgi:hypothetical protein